MRVIFRAPSRFAEIQRDLNFLNMYRACVRSCLRMCIHSYDVLISYTSSAQFPPFICIPEFIWSEECPLGRRGRGDMGLPESYTCYSRTLVTLMRSAVMTGALRMGSDICPHTGFAPPYVHLWQIQIFCFKTNNTR